MHWVPGLRRVNILLSLGLLFPLSLLSYSVQVVSSWGSRSTYETSLCLPKVPWVLPLG